MARAPAALRHLAGRAARALAAAGPPAAGDGIAVAVSGGADSLALLHALRTLAGPRRWRLVVVTVDHGLRPDSAADAAFVADHAKLLGLSTQLLTIDPAELERHRAAGPEGAARAARYQALRQAAAAAGCRFIATGHTLDDQAETVLLQLLRGAGPGGVAGMAIREGDLLRPLLGVRRAETRACCEAVGVAWREDPSNADEDLLRNAVRRRVLPLLEELRPGAARTLARHAALAAEERDWLAPLTGAALSEVLAEGEHPQPAQQGRAALRAAPLAALPPALGRRVVRAAAGRTGVRAPGAEATDQVLALARGAPARAGPVAWPGGRAVREGGLIVVTPNG
jgi:tRNA(Ile)-lysidine synthase